MQNDPSHLADEIDLTVKVCAQDLMVSVELPEIL